MTHKVIFAGCSWTAGNGWQDLPPRESERTEFKDSPFLWVNIVHQEIAALRKLELINIGKGGASNSEIFENIIQTLMDNVEETELVICQWTSMPRYNFQAGFETWNTLESLHKSPLGRPSHPLNLNKNVSWDRKYLNDLMDRFLVLHHLHWEILKVVRYSSIITKLCSKLGIKSIFINGLCPWDQDYFNIVESNSRPEDLTPFTKKEILNIESRDDQEIWQLYNQMHQDYRSAGGIDPKNWINLYSPWNKQKIDTNHDNQHPGIVTNQLYSKQVKNYFDSQNYQAEKG